MTRISPRILTGIALAAIASVGAAQQPMPRTTSETIKNQSSAKTEQLRGTVAYVEGNRLVVAMSSGDLRTFDVPAERRFVIDGKELTAGQLEVGTKLTATVTTTTTSLTDRTTTVGSGKVWYVSGNTVILTLPNNENRMYKVAESYRFTVDGKKATVHDLRKGMTIAAEKIVESPRTEVASNVAVTGSAPVKPSPTVAAAPPRPRPAPPAPAPAAAPAPAPVETAAAAPPPVTLPKTASPLPLIGLLGLLCTGASLALRRLRLS